MNTSHDDPRLTAYALGEMSGEERLAFEAQLAKHPDLALDVDAIRETAELLENELAQGAPEALSAGQHADIERRARSVTRQGLDSKRTTGEDDTQPGDEPQPIVASNKQRARRRVAVAGAVLATAACVVLVFRVSGNEQRESEQSQALVDGDGQEGTQQEFGIRRPGAPSASGSTEGRRIARLDVPRRQHQGGGLGVSPHTVQPSGVHRSAVQNFAPPPMNPFSGGGIVKSKQGFRSSKPGRTVRTPEKPKPKRTTARYAHIPENPFVPVADDSRSTFSIDVDTAAYSVVRQHLEEGKLPPPGAVRIEELINYFAYDYARPTGDVPFSVHTEVSAAPWKRTHQLVRIGLRGKHIAPSKRADANLVFLIDVSGSMSGAKKLPLLKQGLALLVDQLDANDRVAIVVYAGAGGLVLPPTAGDDRATLFGALERLEAGGSTNGGSGIRLAYDVARQSFRQGAINRVILATDGDFNVGTTNESELVRLIEAEAKSGVYLSVLGFGSGNYNDSTLEKLAQHGNGNYAYIDRVSEARKVLVEQASGTLITIAQDVKIQVEMNPSKVAAFRLIGYENRVLEHRDFEDDTKDAGEIGADHTVTALYEVVPKGQRIPGVESRSGLRYQKPAEPTERAHSNELLTVKLRYKQPGGGASREIEQQVEAGARPFASASKDHRFAAAVASYGMLLRGSRHKGDSSFAKVEVMALGSAGTDPQRQEFISLVRRAKALAP